MRKISFAGAKNIFSKAGALITLAILLIAGWFYWFQFRPSKIISRCNNAALTAAKQKLNSKDQYRRDDYQFYFEQCLRKRGLVKN